MLENVSQLRERAQAIGRSEKVKQQKAEGGVVEVQQQYGVQEREKVWEKEDCRVRGERNKLRSGGVGDGGGAQNECVSWASGEAFA